MLLSMICDDPLLVDPGSLSDTAKELDMVFSVTCAAKQEHGNSGSKVFRDWSQIMSRFRKVQTPVTSGIDACVDLHLWVRGDHAGPPGVGAHLRPNKISNHKLLAEARLLDY